MESHGYLFKWFTTIHERLASTITVMSVASKNPWVQEHFHPKKARRKEQLQVITDVRQGFISWENVHMSTYGRNIYYPVKSWDLSVDQQKW